MKSLVVCVIIIVIILLLLLLLLLLLFFFFEEHQILSDSQYGFRTSQSRADLLTTVMGDWLLAKDNKLCTVVIFVDLSKAFDNVQHKKLLNILQSCNIGGNDLLFMVPVEN